MREFCARRVPIALTSGEDRSLVAAFARENYERIPPHLYTQTISDHFRIENFSSFCGLGLLTFPQEDSTASPTLYQGEALTTPVGESNQTSLRARCVWLCSDGRQSAETLLWRSDLACFAQQENEPDEALRLQRGLTISH